MTLAELEAERQRVTNRINDLYWTFTRTARGKPPAATAEGAGLYARRRELEAAIRVERAALRELCGAADPCPTDPAAAREHHRAVKAEVAAGAPVSVHARYLAATLRPWPEVGELGECTCGTSLLITDEPDDDECNPLGEDVMPSATNARAPARAGAI